MNFGIQPERERKKEGEGGMEKRQRELLGGRGWEGRVREGGREPLIAQKGILITQLRILFGDKRRREEK